MEKNTEKSMSGSSIFLGLRAITQKNLQFFLENKPKFMEKMNQSKGDSVDANEKYYSDDYINLLGLVSHKNKDLLSDIWNLTLSCFLLQCLSYTGWLPSTSLSLKLTDDEEYLALLLVHLRGVTQFNTHQVAEMLSCEGGLLKSQEVGMAVRPTVALLNHSCWPNTVRCSTGYNVVIMATFSIQPGEEVSDIYTESFHDITRIERQAKCTSYKFTCRCRACRGDWPLLDELPTALHQTPKSMLAEKVPMHVVVKMGEEMNFVEMKARELFAAGQTRQALMKWREMCQLAESLVKHPSKMFIIVRKQIQICLWKLHGSRIAKELQGTWMKKEVC